MCEYCEGKKEIKSCNFCGEANIKICKKGIVKGMGLIDVYGNEKRFNLFKKIYLPSFNINYCPMCGKRLGVINNVDTYN